MSDPLVRESGNVAGGCQDNGCQALQWNVGMNRAEAERDRYRAALELVLDIYDNAPVSELTKLRRISVVAREALEGP